MAYEYFKELHKRVASDKVLDNKALNIKIIHSMIDIVVNGATHACVAKPNQQFANKIQKLMTKKLKHVQSIFIFY